MDSAPAFTKPLTAQPSAPVDAAETERAAEKNKKLFSFFALVKQSADAGARESRAFMNGLLLGEAARATLPHPTDGIQGVPDNVMFFFELGLNLHEAWTEIDKQLRPLLIQAIVGLILGAVGMGAGKKK